MGTETFTPLPEPPSLGTFPKGTRGRALILSALLYGGLLTAAMFLLLSPRPVVSVKRTLAVTLDDYDAFPAPPPPPSGASGGTSPSPSPAPAPRVEALSPVVLSGEVHPAIASPLPASPLPASTPAAEGPSGQPGGAWGQPGGVAGGQAGGVAGGQVGGIVSPRFDAAYLQNPEPDYPGLSKRLGEEGRVLLRVHVNEEGLADHLEIRESSGHPRLDQAALGTVRRWRFIPARRGTEPLAAWVLVPLSFHLDA